MDQAGGVEYRVDRQRSAAGENQQEKAPAEQGGQFAIVLNGQQAFRLMLGEVGERHGARGDERRYPGACAEQNRYAGEEFDGAGPPAQ
ncbi:Uncharacterised protein [Mycobacteroides abscessus subsp. abscessus]|nr:Uncharacterised protein [Mycobacteroides abscessus subsp. abscessus]